MFLKSYKRLRNKQNASAVSVVAALLFCPVLKAQAGRRSLGFHCGPRHPPARPPPPHGLVEGESFLWPAVSSFLFAPDSSPSCKSSRKPESYRGWIFLIFFPQDGTPLAALTKPFGASEAGGRETPQGTAFISKAPVSSQLNFAGSLPYITFFSCAKFTTERKKEKKDII